MSALNGDKARFQRQRKAGLRRRERSRAAQAALRLAAPQPRTNEVVARIGGEEGRRLE